MQGDVVDMSNLMMFEEDNLLHHTDRCYEKEYMTPNAKDSDNSTECPVNIPLISPQSTLHDKPLKSVPESPLSTETVNLLTFLQGNSTDDKSVLNPFVSALQTDQEPQPNKKLSTNPFLEDMNKCQDRVNNLSPEMFMQIWETNLRLQMQITTIFNVLMAKLDSSTNNINNYSSENEIKENHEKRLLHASELLESIILEEDISSLLASKAANYSKNMNIDTRSNKSNDIFTSSFLNNTDYATAKHSETNDNSISTALLEYLKQINEIDGSTVNSTSQALSTKLSFLGQDIGVFAHSSVMNNLKIETSTFQCQNGFMDNKKDHLYSPSSEQYNDDEFSETNPFKLLLKMKDCKSINATQAENINTDFEKYCSLSNTNLEKNQFEINNIGDHTSTIQHDNISSSNKSVLNPFSSEFVPSNQQDPFCSFQNTQNVTFQSETRPQNITKDQYQFKEECNTAYENLGISPNPDHNYFNTYSTTFKDNNVDESVIHSEEFLWPDRSNNIKTNIEEATIKNSEESPNILAETWIRDVKNTILSQAQVQDKNNITLQALNKNQQFKTNTDSFCYTNSDSGLIYSTNKEHINSNTTHSNYSKRNHVTFQISNEEVKRNIDTNNIDCKGQTIKDDSDTTSVNMMNGINDIKLDIPYHEFLISTATGPTKLFLQTIEIKNKIFCIFHFEDEGWLLVNNFVEEFTNYETMSEYYKQLQINRIKIKFKEINRFESPILFFQLDKILLNISRDNANKVNKIHLMPLKSVITVLVKLQIVARSEIDTVITKKEFTQRPILQVWILIRTYGKLKDVIQEKLISKKT